MSEYRYYEFQTIDRRLDQKEMQDLRGYSSRARITPTSFTMSIPSGASRGMPMPGWRNTSMLTFTLPTGERMNFRFVCQPDCLPQTRRETIARERQLPFARRPEILFSRSSRMRKEAGNGSKAAACFPRFSPCATI